MEVNFLSPPKWKVNDTGVYLIGCEYDAPIDLNAYSLLLFNGTVESIQNTVASQKSAKGTFQIQTIRIYKLGSYQCVIQHPRIKGFKKISEKSSSEGLQGMIDCFNDCKK